MRLSIEVFGGQRTAPFVHIFGGEFERMEYGPADCVDVGQRAAQPRFRRWRGCTHVELASNEEFKAQIGVRTNRERLAECGGVR